MSITYHRVNKKGRRKHGKLYSTYARLYTLMHLWKRMWASLGGYNSLITVLILLLPDGGILM